MSKKISVTLPGQPRRHLNGNAGYDMILQGDRVSARTQLSQAVSPNPFHWEPRTMGGAMSKRFSLVLTDAQAAALTQYAQERWMQPAGVLRTALFQYMSAKALYRDLVSNRATMHQPGESSGKVDYENFGDLFPVVSDPPVDRDKEIVHKASFWPLIRARIFERDSFRCRVCGKDGTLHAHHIVKRRDGGRDIEENLISLCPACHSRADYGQLEGGVWALRDPYYKEPPKAETGPKGADG